MAKPPTPWYRSNAQIQDLLYRQMRVPPVLHRKTRRPTLDDDALGVVRKREPGLGPLVDRLLEYRSLGVLRSTFLGECIDPDGRVRCSYNVAGTENFRFSSSKNAFGTGMNLQNIPREKASLRRMFVPSPGYVLVDADLAGADAQVVAWEADDADLKARFRAGADLHTENAKDIFGACAGKGDSRRQQAKNGVHAVNYGAQARTLAATLGITIREAESFMARWFGAHPGIVAWHNRVRGQLHATRMVRNKFGFRRLFFDRLDSVFNEALAWVPASTVAHVTNLGLLALNAKFPYLELLMQVHDSLVFQIPHAHVPDLPAIQAALEIPIPYPDPLTIPVGIKTSSVSWGECG